MFPESILLSSQCDKGRNRPQHVNDQKKANILVDVLGNSLRAMKPKGQTRMDGLFMNPESTPDVEYMLKEEFPNVRVSYDRPLMVVDKLQ